MGCRHSKADDIVISLTARDGQKSLRDNVTSDLIQHKYVNDMSEFFDVSTAIGTSYFSCVKHAASKNSGKAWAVKIVALSNQVDRDALWNEISILKRLHHPQIVQIRGSYEDKEHLYMVMQLCEGKELYEQLYQEQRKFTETDVRKVIRALLRALVFLHSNSIIHRDLKLENLLLTDAADPGSIRLCNFGLSTRLQRGEKLIEPVGTIDYVAPEVLDGEYDEKCDLWSVGVICFELLTGTSPFHGETIDDTMEKIYDGVLIFETEVWSQFSPGSILFIKSLVKGDVDERLSAKQALATYWLNEEEIMSVDTSLTTRVQNDTHVLLTNMRRFGKYQKLKQTALLAIALVLSDEHIQQKIAVQVFHSMDYTNTGSLSRTEFCCTLLESGLTNEEESSTLFQCINQSKSGYINFLEFMAATIDELEISTDTIKEAFSIFDSKNHGRLSTIGLQHVFRNSIKAEEVDEMIASIDSKNEGGYVDFNEFQGLFVVAETGKEVTGSQSTTAEGSMPSTVITSALLESKPHCVEMPIVKSESFNTGTDSLTDTSIASSTPSVTSYYESGLTLATRHEPMIVAGT
uniref:Protein kinase domain-containing protein n=1 Tax=Hyaloperonospora arabidopsidis (strain Emoy2) TaxID=559515 RepID=M4BPY6_HYAAE